MGLCVLEAILLCGHDDGGREEEEGPECGDKAVAEEPGHHQTPLVSVSEPEVLSPGGGEGKVGGVLPETHQTKDVQQAEETKQNTWVVMCNKMNYLALLALKDPSIS